MSEEIKSSIEVPLTEIEVKAQEKGWIPPHEFVGNKEEFISAEKWMENYTWLHQIKNLKKETVELKKAVNHLVDHNTKIEHITEQKVREELLAQQRQAVIDGDVDRVTAITNKLVEQPAPKKEVPEAAKEFIAKHSSWFNDESSENSRMKQAAIASENFWLASRPDLTDRERLVEVEKELARVYPHKFPEVSGGVDPRKSPSPVASATQIPVKKDEYDTSQLDSFDKSLIDRLQKTVKNFDLKRYLEQKRQIDMISKSRL